MQKINEIVGTLINSQLFSGLSDDEIGRFSRILTLKKYNKGETLFAEGDRAEGFHIVKSGKIKIFKISSSGKMQILHIFGPGNPFGEAAIFMGNRFPAYAEAVTASETVFIDFDDFTTYLKKEPRFALNIIATLCIRLKGFLKTIEDLSLNEVSSRLARYLIDLAEEQNDEPGDGCAVTLSVKKGLLAQQLGTIPETFSRTLAKLREQGIVETTGKKIIIADYDRLAEMSGTGQ